MTISAWSLNLLLLVALPFSGVQAAPYKASPFTFTIKTRNVELGDVSTVIVCNQPGYVNNRDFSKKAPFALKEEFKIGGDVNRLYQVFSPGIFGGDAPPVNQAGVCSLRIEFADKSGKEKAVYALGAENQFPLNDSSYNTTNRNSYFINDCANQTFTVREIKGDFAAACPAYENFYANARANLGKITLHSTTQEKGRIFISLTDNYTQQFAPAFKAAKAAYEEYWRNMRLGQDTVEVVTVLDDLPKKKTFQNLGALIGVEVYENHPISGYLIGAWVGSLFDKKPQPFIRHESQTRPFPDLEADVSTALLQVSYVATKWRQSGGAFTVSVPKLTSGSDIASYIEILDLYASLLSQRKALSSEQIAGLNRLKAIYGPNAYSLFDYILATDYAAQGSCVLQPGKCKPSYTPYSPEEF